MGTWDGKLERRAFPRRTARATARYREEHQRALTDFSARLVDLSQCGLGLVLQRPPAGKVIEVELLPASGRPVACRAEVRWTLALPDGSYRMGGPLQPRLSYADLQRLLPTRA